MDDLGRTSARTFASTPAAASEARRFVRGVLARLPIELVDDVATMVSELASNAIRHVSTDFTVSVEQGPAEVRVAVTDTGPGLPRLRNPSPDDANGRGLVIVRALARRWGVDETPGRAGKTVWFTVAVPRSCGGRRRARESATAGRAQAPRPTQPPAGAGRASQAGAGRPSQAGTGTCTLRRWRASMSHMRSGR
jgi:anti-sigma regulatory factor (Ser/Thr protein kinase)